MSIKKLNPFLAFDGTADKAIALYERTLGAKTETVTRMGDIPGNKPAPENKNRIMHALLRVGEGELMVMDNQPGVPLAIGTNVHMSLDFDDVADMAAKFDALAAGGKVTMPLQDTFWGAKFGMLDDAFGVRWMFNCQLKKS
jgi:PhnB protein